MTTQAQTCRDPDNSSSASSEGHDEYADATDCWPPASSGAPVPTAPLNGWGFYSPAFYCPVGYTSACSTTQGGHLGGGNGVVYSLISGETAVGCCPQGFTCSVNGVYQTCKSEAGYGAAFPVVTCESGSSNGFTEMAIPATIEASSTTYNFAAYDMYAPMIEIRWQSSDRPAKTPAMTTSTSSTLSSRTGTSTPSNGLATSTKIAIGATVPALVIIAAVLLGVLLWRRKRGRAPDTKQDPTESKFDSSSPVLDHNTRYGPYREPRWSPLHEMEEQRFAQELESKNFALRVRHELEGGLK